LDRKHHVRALRKELFVVLERWCCAHFLQIVAGAESFARGSKNHHSNRFILTDRVQFTLQRC
jgi:hypothetical protein